MIGRIKAQIIARMSSSKLGNGVAFIASGTLIGQGLAVLASPVLSRLYTPAEFGVFSVISALAFILAAPAAGRLESAVPLPRSDVSAHALMTAGAVSALMWAPVSYLIVLVGALLLGYESALLWLWPAPLIATLVAWYAVLNQYAVRRKDYQAIARRNAIQAVAMVITQIGLGIAAIGSGGLIAGLAAGQLVSVIALSTRVPWRSVAAKGGRRWRAITAALKRYKKFPLVLSPAALLNILGVYAPVILFSHFYGVDVAGWLGLTQRVLALPVMLIGTAVAQVFLGELARLATQAPGEARRLFYVATRWLSFAAGILVLVLVPLAPDLFQLIFGSDWRASGEYARLLAIALGAQLVAAPLSTTLTVYERYGWQVSWDTARLLLTAGGVVVAHWLGVQAIGALWVYSIAATVSYLAQWLLARAAVHRILPGEEQVGTATE